MTQCPICISYMYTVHIVCPLSFVQTTVYRHTYIRAVTDNGRSHYKFAQMIQKSSE